jgi:2-haloacid dehalogenase
MLFRFIRSSLWPDYSPVNNASPSYTAAIFDLGGVFIDWNPRYLYRKLFAGDDAAMERFLADVTTSAWNLQMDAGKAFAEAVEELQREHLEQADLIAAYHLRWPEMLGEVNAETAQIVRDLKARRLHVYALSNWSAETFPYAREVAGELELFEDILISGEMRITKPDPRAFAHAAERFGVDPATTLFVDDVPANVAAAREAGFSGFLFRTAAELSADLTELGIL